MAASSSGLTTTMPLDSFVLQGMDRTAQPVRRPRTMPRGVRRARRNAVSLERWLVPRRSAYQSSSFRNSGHVGTYKYSIRTIPANVGDHKAEKSREERKI